MTTTAPPLPEPANVYRLNGRWINFYTGEQITERDNWFLARLRAAEVDARRYRWLRENPNYMGWEHDFRADEIDREIDRAMGSTTSGGDK